MVDQLDPRGHVRATSWPTSCAPRPSRPRPRSTAGSPTSPTWPAGSPPSTCWPGEQLLASRFVRPDDLQAPGTVEVPDGPAGGQRAAGAAAGGRRPPRGRRHRGRLPVPEAARTAPARPHAVLHGCSSPRCRAPRRRSTRPPRAGPRRRRPPAPPPSSLMVTLALTAPGRRDRRLRRSSTARSGCPWSPTAPTRAARASSTRATIYVEVPR